GRMFSLSENLFGFNCAHGCQTANLPTQRDSFFPDCPQPQLSPQVETLKGSGEQRAIDCGACGIQEEQIITKATASWLTPRSPSKHASARTDRLAAHSICRWRITWLLDRPGKDT